jgi:hypothetical protein
MSELSPESDILYAKTPTAMLPVPAVRKFFPKFGTNGGHGHVWQRPDGMVSKCGGPSLCRSCRIDEELFIQAAKWAAEDSVRLEGTVITRPPEEPQIFHPGLNAQQIEDVRAILREESQAIAESFKVEFSAKFDEVVTQINAAIATIVALGHGQYQEVNSILTDHDPVVKKLADESYTKLFCEEVNSR